MRNGETNMGDFIADAFKYVTGAEIGVANGGSIRAEIPVGDITFGQLLSVSPFSNAGLAWARRSQVRRLPMHLSTL